MLETIQHFTDILQSFNLGALEWVLIMLCGILIGATKTGLSGAAFIVVPTMAMIFGGQPSTGLLLPMLIMGDIFGVSYYNRHANWKYVLKPIPWAFAGVVIGVMIGNQVSGEIFTTLIAITIIMGVVLMVWQDNRKNQITVPDYWWFSAIIGIIGGFSTMIGNSAGPIMSIYLLTMYLPKNMFIGTKAWFFMIINVTKVPFHVFSWNTIDLRTFAFDLAVLPAIVIGAFIGVRVVKLIPEKGYRILVIVTTVVACIIMLTR
ncbi:MAG: sulfite exporter TauE/SafE family protein [Bacteroidales bacterium]|nr:sulfite exporter TauE/SafE family protein [Bacteroidales bacterium]